jgi:hypothetical protein
MEDTAAKPQASFAKSKPLVFLPAPTGLSTIHGLEMFQYFVSGRALIWK